MKSLAGEYIGQLIMIKGRRGLLLKSYRLFFVRDLTVKEVSVCHRLICLKREWYLDYEKNSMFIRFIRAETKATEGFWVLFLYILS
jgi:hypothetical protein